MRLFTFSSRESTRPFLSLKGWLASLILFALLITVGELFWRAKGFLPGIMDSKMFWSLHRARLDKNEDHNKLVILGTSRAMVGINPEEISRFFPDYEVVHLPLNGISPYHPLKDIVGNSGMKGVILTDMPVWGLIRPSEEGRGTAWPQFYHQVYKKHSSIDEKLNTLIMAWLQGHLATLSPKLTLRALLDKGFRSRPRHSHMKWNRFMPADYQRLPERKLKRLRQKFRGVCNEKKIHAPERHDAFRKSLQNYFKPLNQAALKRNIRIYFLRMPLGEARNSNNECNFPKKEYWDVITPLTGIPVIHPADYLSLQGFHIPDESHLDASETIPFTRNLARILLSLDRYHDQKTGSKVPGFNGFREDRHAPG